MRDFAPLPLTISTSWGVVQKSRRVSTGTGFLVGAVVGAPLVGVLVGAWVGCCVGALVGAGGLSISRSLYGKGM